MSYVKFPPGLGNPALRANNSQADMTAAEFEYLKKHPSQVPDHMRKYFEETLRWEKRSASSKRAVQTKRRKYAKWPGGRKAKS